MIFLIPLMYAVWSSVFSLGKIALEISPPLFLTATRFLLAGVLLLSYLFFFKRDALRLTGKQLASLALLGLFSTYLSNACEFWGLQHMTPAKTCFIYSLSPFFAALFSFLHFGERMNGRKWVGLLIGVSAVFAYLFFKSPEEMSSGGIAFISWPELALMGAALFAVYGWVLLRVVVKDSVISPLTANGVSMLFGGLMALVHSLFIDSWTPTPIPANSFLPFSQGLLLMTLISNILCYNLYGFLLKRFTATLLSFAGLLSPVFASFNSYFLLGQPLEIPIFLVTGVVSVGMWLVYSAELRQGYVITATPAQSTN